MTSKQRVLAAIQHQEADRPPTGHMGFCEKVSRGIRRRLGAPDDAGLMDLLGLDLTSMGPEYIGPEFDYKPADTRRSFFSSSHKTYADDLVRRPLREAQTVADVEAFRWPTIKDYSFANVAREFDAKPQTVVRGPAWTPTFSQLCELFGIEATLVNLLDKPALMEAAIEHITNLVCDMARQLRRASRGEMFIFATADDYATQRGMMFSPAVWRKLFKPGLARQFAVAKNLGMYVMIHACGDVSAILPELVEIGLDILEPTQCHLPGMRPERLKREFGSRLTFFGGISTQHVLPEGAPDDVRREVRERIRVLGQGGGYIVSPDHEVLDDVPPENVIALYEAAGSLRRR